MNKKAIWIGVAVLVFLVAAWAFTLSRKNVVKNQNSGTSEKKQEQANQKSTTLKELMGQSVSQKCTFNDPTVPGDSSGVVYMSNNKLRGDFQAKTDGRTINSHMITDGKYNYIWMDGGSMGVKMSLSEPQSAGQAEAQLNNQMNFSCEAWTASDEILTPPANITFQDFAKIPATAKPVGSDPEACKLCDSLTDPAAKLQCRSAQLCK